MPDTTELNNKKPLKYSVCTLMNNPEEYEIMVKSYKKAGFTEDICEYLFVDNSTHNQYDAFTGLNYLISKASGKYLILSHQDTETIFDNEEVLNKRIEEINQIDSNWAVLGNAGGADVKRLYRRITHLQENIKDGPFPQRVRSLDENFILLKSSAQLTFSSDLTGFHLYGTDICITAEKKGYTCYVIDFNLLHKSNGNINESFFAARRAFMQKYAQQLPPQYIRTTCTTMFISDKPWLNFIMNKPFMISVSKFLKKLELTVKGINY